MLDCNSKVVNPPFRHVPYPYQREYRVGQGGRVIILLPSKWAQPDTNASVLVDILDLSTSRKKIRLTRRSVQVSPNEDVHVTVVSTNYSPGLKSLYFTAGVRPYSTLGSDLYIAGRIPLRPESESVVIHSSTSGNVNADGEMWQTVECAVEHGVDTCSLICPYSGRFAYVCQYGHGDGCNRIHVVDTLDA